MQQAGVLLHLPDAPVEFLMCRDWELINDSPAWGLWTRGAACLAQIALHMIISMHSPPKQPLFLHELLFQLSALRVFGMGVGGLFTLVQPEPCRAKSGEEVLVYSWL